jgi:hypothetical protein
LEFQTKSLKGKQHSNVFLQVQKFKEEAESISWQLKSKEPENPSQKLKNTYVK